MCDGESYLFLAMNVSLHNQRLSKNRIKYGFIIFQKENVPPAIRQAADKNCQGVGWN